MEGLMFMGKSQGHALRLGFSWVTVLAQPWTVFSGINENHSMDGGGEGTSIAQALS